VFSSIYLVKNVFSVSSNKDNDYLRKKQMFFLKFLFKKIVCFLQFFITFAPYKMVSN